MPEEFDPNDPAQQVIADAPARAAFEAWYGFHAGTPVSDDAWSSLGEHQEVWRKAAEAAITAYEDPENLGPLARDMEPEELKRFRNGNTR